jgi:hypothetical protein
MSERMERLKSLASLTGLDAQDREDVLWAHDEIERLREVNQKWLEYSQREIEPELKGQVAELAVECKRFRAALRAIRDLDGNPYEQDHVYLAKEALGDE